MTFNLIGCSLPSAIRLWTPKQCSTIVLSHVIQWGIECRIFRGHFGHRPIVAKICGDRTHRAESGLREEYAIYQALRNLQGSAIPRCYGLLRVGDFANMLLLEDCGNSLKSYDGLTPNQRCASCVDKARTPLNDPRASLLSHVSNIHRRNVCHQDLEPRNIVMSMSGQLRVVDFELSDRFHKCVPQDCHKLQDLVWETQGSPLKDVSRLGSNGHVWLLSAMLAGMSWMMVVVYLLQHHVLCITN